MRQAMPERPLLILPSPGAPLARQKGRGFGGEKFQRPSVERQKERLSPQFKRLQQAFDERRVRLQTESRDLVPEEVIVLETVGAVDDFIRAVERVPGMEWLAEVEVEGIPPDDDFFATALDGETRLDKDLRGRVFLVFSDQDALKYLMSLWKTWQSREKLPYRFGKWKARTRTDVSLSSRSNCLVSTQWYQPCRGYPTVTSTSVT